MRCHRTDELPLEERQKWAAARVWAAHQAPYLSTALLTLDPVVVDATATDAQAVGDDVDVLDRDLRDAPAGAPIDVSRFPTDTEWHVYIGPATLRALEVPQIGFWLIHQVTHLLREHAARYPGALSFGDDDAPEPTSTRNPDQRRWNLSADAEIADAAAVAGRPPPDDSVAPERLGLEAGQTSEHYWTALGERAEPVPQALADVDCGTGCDGRPRPWNCGWPGLSKFGAQLTSLETARRIRDHIKSRDDIPAGWLRWATDLLEPSVNWRRVLAAQVRRGVANVAGRVDFTYRKPSRRAAALPGVIMPSMHQPLPVVAVVIDTSGSMSDAMLGQALGEVNGVLHGLGIGRGQLKVITCDVEAYAPQAVHQVADLRLAGGGGTDMRTGLAAAVNLRPRPDLIVALTDGHSPWPNTPPRKTRVVIGLMDPTGEAPDWADSVLIGDQHDD
ncbi:VWA-like domain-containing protein [Actinoallomurus spadix]|uniref:VWA-like domain-containing protein n=1 Tax=Actinoallomurus spadix TaxID=79912 RepID=A0ABN0WYX6_9ACTN|nr:VWA-like domain-containing protein [Actinoallomurus spadix]MCO5989137.1 VWA-like domain-containing protein [Actinoallomurus spadix]